MGVASPTCVLSGRAQDRLSKLQRELQLEMRSLFTHQSLLAGALQACDLTTQGAQLREYLDRVEAVLAAATHLSAFVSRHAQEMTDPSPNRIDVEQVETEDAAPMPSLQKATLFED